MKRWNLPILLMMILALVFAAGCTKKKAEQQEEEPAQQQLMMQKPESPDISGNSSTMPPQNMPMLVKTKTQTHYTGRITVPDNVYKISNLSLTFEYDPALLEKPQVIFRGKIRKRAKISVTDGDKPGIFKVQLEADGNKKIPVKGTIAVVQFQRKQEDIPGKALKLTEKQFSGESKEAMAGFDIKLE